MYGSEIWGTCSKSSIFKNSRNDYKLEKAYENVQCDKLCLKFYKYILGVHSKTSNIAVMGELGRRSVTEDIICSMLKYYHRIANMDENSLLYQSLLANKKLDSDNVDCWFSCIKFILQQLNVNNLDQINIDVIKRKLVSRYEDFWYSNISENAKNQGKLRTYFKFKSIFKREFYLNAITDIELRQSFTRFRISSHDLEIERGRYRNIKKENRLCSRCSDNCVEDELHFLLHCSKYKSKRDCSFKRVSEKYNNFDTLSDSEKFIWLMSCEDQYVIDELSHLIFECNKIRKF